MHFKGGNLVFFAVATSLESHLKFILNATLQLFMVHVYFIIMTYFVIACYVVDA